MAVVPALCSTVTTGNAAVTNAAIALAPILLAQIHTQFWLSAPWLELNQMQDTRN